MNAPKKWLHSAMQQIPQTVRDTLKIRAFGAMKVPLILYCSPSVIKLDAKSCALRIPLCWRTRNHYKSMYFGVLAVGADCTAGLLVLHLSRQFAGMGLLFKDFQANFHKRATGDVVFNCNDGPRMADMIKRASLTGTRINESVRVDAHVPSDNHAHVATMTLTLSLKQARPQERT